jgi:hypothetical protein
VTPVLREYSQASAKPVVQAIEDARNKHVEANLDQVLANRFGKRMVAPIKAIHETGEGRPIEPFGTSPWPPPRTRVHSRTPTRGSK